MMCIKDDNPGSNYIKGDNLTKSSCKLNSPLMDKPILMKVFTVAVWSEAWRKLIPGWNNVIGDNSG